MNESYKLTPEEIAEHYHNEDGIYVYAKEVADHASEKAWPIAIEKGKRDERERIYQVDKKTLLRNWKEWNDERERTAWAAT